MRSFRLAVLFLTISSWGALAADNAVIVTPGSGVTMRSKDIGAGVQSMMPIPGDVAGDPLATAPGSGNASYALPMQGVAGGVAMPISGTITANAGTNLNTSALALENGGNLAAIAGAITSSVMQVNLKQLNGAALGSPSNYGTSPGAVEVQGVNAYVTNSVAVTGTFYQATQPVSIASAQVASGAFASGSLAAGSMVDLLTMRATIAGTGSEPADVLAEGCQYNSSLPTFTNTFVGGAQCDASGRQITVGAGTAGTAAGGVVTVQGVASMTPVQVSQATAASLNATVIGTGTFAVQATLQASATTAIGKVDPNTIATWGLATVGAGSAPTNMQVGGLVYNSGGVTPSSGQSVALQGDANGYLEVNVKTATGLVEGSTTSGQTGSMIMAATTSAPPSLTTAQTNYLLDRSERRTCAPRHPASAIPSRSPKLLQRTFIRSPDMAISARSPHFRHPAKYQHFRRHWLYVRHGYGVPDGRFWRYDGSRAVRRFFRSERNALHETQEQRRSLVRPAKQHR